MIADRWPDERLAEPGETGCYGKIASEREFVRLGIDSGEALWVSGLVSSAHDLMVEAAAEVVEGRELRVIVVDPDSETLFAVLLRGSRDSVGRRYPVSLFCTLDRTALSGEPFLAPLYMGDLWMVFGSQVLSAVDGDADIADLIEACAVDLVEAEEARGRHAANLDAPLADPWAALCGDGGNRDWQLARIIRGLDDSCQEVFLDPRWYGDAPLVAGANRTAVLWHLLSSHSPIASRWWGVIEVWDRADQADWRAVEIFAREVGAADIARLLTVAGDVEVPTEVQKSSVPDGWGVAHGDATVGCLRGLLARPACPDSESGEEIE